MSTMKWEEIKKSIVDDIKSRGLKDPKIRIRALNNVEAIIREHFPEWIANPDELKNVNKDKFKREIFYKKGKSLNGAENTVINAIYYRVKPIQKTSTNKKKIPPRISSNNLVHCPNCGTLLLLSKELVNERHLKCLVCGTYFINPNKTTSIDKNYWIAPIVVVIMVTIVFVFSGTFDSNHNQTYSKSTQTKDVIGVWADDFTKGIIWRIRIDNNANYILELGENQSNRWINPHKLVKISKNGQVCYDDLDDEDRDEHYRIEDNGDLSVYDNYGYIATYKKVK
jgi:ribosomal protein S27E